jgi:hypothetical protein
MRRFVRAVFLLLGTALLIYLLWRLGPLEVLRLIGRIGWSALLILLCFLAYQVLRALALRLSVVRLDALRWRDAFAIRCSGEAVQALTFTGPALAEPTKAWLITRRGLTLQEGFAATITEYLVCTLVSAALAIPGLVYLALWTDASAVVARIAWGLAAGMFVFLAVSAVAIARRYYLIGTVIAALGRVGLLRGRLTPDMKWVNRMEDLLLAILRERPARLAIISFVELAAQALLVLEVMFALHALAPAAPALSAYVFEASAKFSAIAFAFIPMQIGAAEGTYAVIFDALALPSAAGVALALVRRARSLLVAGIGLSALAVFTRDQREEAGVS